MAVRRSGELSEQSLVHALADEEGRGARPIMVAVGSDELAVAARRILDPRGLGQLTSALPNVEVDADLGAGEWELREDEPRA